MLWCVDCGVPPLEVWAVHNYMLSCFPLRPTAASWCWEAGDPTLAEEGCQPNLTCTDLWAFDKLAWSRIADWYRTASCQASSCLLHRGPGLVAGLLVGVLRVARAIVPSTIALLASVLARLFWEGCPGGGCLGVLL